ncbi:MAG: hypothetical protein K2M57_00780, partial [Paramuribaculum sp.]|nr:hypothetical protein [Paramuribaculum sp.]
MGNFFVGFTKSLSGMGIMVVAFCLVWKGTDCDLKTGSDAAFCAAVVGAVYLPRGNYFSPVPQAEPH